MTDEHTAARGKCSGTRRIIAGLSLSLLAGGAHAVPGTCSGASTTISTAVTHQCYLPNGGSVAVTNSGSITESSGPAVYAYNDFGTISNAGNIVSTYGINNLLPPGAAILLQAGAGATNGISITNLAGATIHGKEAGIHADGWLYDITIGHIDNAGTIVGDIAGLSLVGTTVINGITNTGLIGGDLYAVMLAYGSTNQINNDGIINGNEHGVALFGANADMINNSGTINGNTYGLSLIGASNVGLLNNSGIISAGMVAVEVWHSSHIDRLINSGTISSDYLAIEVVDDGSSLSNIDITGTQARVIGDVFAPASEFTLKSGASFSNENAYEVGSFIIENGAVLNMDIGSTSTDELASGITASNGLNNIGTLQLAAGVTGTLYGDYTQATTGTLKIGVASDTSYGKLVVDGSATLASNAKIAVDVTEPNYSFSVQSLQDVLSATTLNSDGTFAVSDNSQLFNFGAIKDGNTVDLTLARAASVLDSVQSTGNNPAEGAAQVLDEVIASDPTGELASQFVGLSSEQEVSDAVTQTLPLLTGGTSGALSSTLSGINRVIQARQAHNGGLSSGDAPLSEENLWIKTFGSWADQDERNNVSGYDADSKGLAIGADAAVSEQTRLGLAFVYAQTDVDSDSSIAAQNAQIDTFQLIGYGSYALAPDTELNFQVDVGQNRNEGTRHLPFADSIAKADYDSYSAHAGLGLEHSLRFSEQLTFVPSVRADYTWIGEESYQEKGAGTLNLDVDSRDAEELILSLDGKLDYRISASTVLSANLGAGYDLINEQTAITSSYAGAAGAAFTTHGLDPEPWRGHAGLGLSHTLDNGTEVSLRYDAESRSDFLNQGASVKARWAF
ncbi:autotransporter domain-containing protein [Pseudomonas sp. J452]|nr:autotransporter domain-containing protein [Pseudomonas sp. J452]